MREKFIILFMNISKLAYILQRSGYGLIVELRNEDDIIGNIKMKIFKKY